MNITQCSSGVTYRREDKEIHFPSLSADSFGDESSLVCQRECAESTECSQGEIKYVTLSPQRMIDGRFHPFASWDDIVFCREYISF